MIQQPEQSSCLSQTNHASSVVNVLDGRAADELFDRMNTKLISKCFLCHSKEFEEVWVCYAPVGETEVTKAYVFNYIAGRVS